MSFKDWDWLDYGVFSVVIFMVIFSCLLVAHFSVALTHELNNYDKDSGSIVTIIHDCAPYNNDG